MPKTKPLAKTNQLQTSYKMEPHSLCSSVEISRQHINTIIDLISPYHHCFTLLLVASLAATLFYACRRKAPIYLIDFTCYCPPSSYRLPLAMFEENQLYDNMDPDAVAFQCKIMAKSGFSEQTSISPSLAQIPKIKALSFALDEAETIMCSVIKDLFEKHNINPKAIDILITNSSVFCPTTPNRTRVRLQT